MKVNWWAIDQVPGPVLFCSFLCSTRRNNRPTATRNTRLMLFSDHFRSRRELQINRMCWRSHKTAHSAVSSRIQNIWKITTESYERQWVGKYLNWIGENRWQILIVKIISFIYFFSQNKKLLSISGRQRWKMRFSSSESGNKRPPFELGIGIGDRRERELQMK